MVGRWGMSQAIGPVAVLPRDGAGPLLPGAAEVSPATQQLIDQEVRRIVEESHKEVVALLKKNRKRLDSLANALLEHETLDEEDAYAAAGVERAARPARESYAAAARSRTPG
jgi:cell division protease FtsH